jgi:hypothetical protein
LSGIQTEVTGPRLFTRAEALVLLKIGETTLFWLQRTGKLRPIRIGSRVLFSAADIVRLATHGATLTEVEKQAASINRSATLSIDDVSSRNLQLGRRGRPRKLLDPGDAVP